MARCFRRPWQRETRVERTLVGGEEKGPAGRQGAAASPCLPSHRRRGPTGGGVRGSGGCGGAGDCGGGNGPPRSLWHVDRGPVPRHRRIWNWKLPLPSPPPARQITYKHTMIQSSRHLNTYMTPHLQEMMTDTPRLHRKERNQKTQRQQNQNYRHHQPTLSEDGH